MTQHELITYCLDKVNDLQRELTFKAENEPFKSQLNGKIVAYTDVLEKLGVSGVVVKHHQHK